MRWLSFVVLMGVAGCTRVNPIFAEEAETTTGTPSTTLSDTLAVTETGRGPLEDAGTEDSRGDDFGATSFTGSTTGETDDTDGGGRTGTDGQSSDEASDTLGDTGPSVCVFVQEGFFAEIVDQTDGVICEPITVLTGTVVSEDASGFTMHNCENPDVDACCQDSDTVAVELHPYDLISPIPAGSCVRLLVERDEECNPTGMVLWDELNGTDVPSALASNRLAAPESLGIDVGATMELVEPCAACEDCCGDERPTGIYQLRFYDNSVADPDGSPESLPGPAGAWGDGDVHNLKSYVDDSCEEHASWLITTDVPVIAGIDPTG